MAASRGLCESRVILSSRNSDGATFGFPSAYEGQGSLDRSSHRISGAKYSACYYNKFYQLEKRGSVLSFENTF